MFLREDVWFIICDHVITLQLDGSYEIYDVGFKKFIENSEIAEASLALVDSPQWNVRMVFQGGLIQISWIWLEYCPIGIHCVLLLLQLLPWWREGQGPTAAGSSPGSRSHGGTTNMG